MNENNWIDFAKSHPLFKELSHEEQLSLFPFISLKTFEEGQWVLREGEPGSDLYILLSGKAEILKEDRDLRLEIPLLLLKEGDWMGEMAWLEKTYIRSASVKTIHQTKIAILKLHRMEKIPHLRPILNKIHYLLAKRIAKQAQSINEYYIDSLDEKLGLLNLQSTISRTIIFLLLCMVPFLNLNHLLVQTETAFSSWNFLLSHCMIGILGIIGLVVVDKSKRPLSFYGLSMNHWLKHSVEAILATLPFLALLIGIKWILITYVPLYQGISLISISMDGQSRGVYFALIALYILLTPFQELLLRGILQTAFKNFFQGTYRVLMAILISNLFLEILSFSSNLWFSIGLFGYGILWGCLYERQNTILGCTISHAILGVAAFFFLGFDSMANLANSTPIAPSN